MYDSEASTPSNTDRAVGRRIYMEALSGRRGFRDDHIGIDDDDIWAEIFEQIGQVARETLTPAA